jgi:CMP-N,N'-diacetyllegionaminic acid synthase
MIAGRSVLALIPARGGSKGLPRKNVLPLAGKPLIAWSIEAALKSKYVDRIVVSSDNDEIIAAARAAGAEVPFVRPADLAGDTTPSLDVALHALQALDQRYDYLVLLQPTSPLRDAPDIDGCIETCVRQAAPSCVSVSKADKSPYWMYTQDAQQRLVPVLPRPDASIHQRQLLPTIYALNGAVYVTQTSALVADRAFVTAATVAWEMPRSKAVDIDGDLDFKIAGLMLEETSES